MSCWFFFWCCCCCCNRRRNCCSPSAVRLKDAQWGDLDVCLCVCVYACWMCPLWICWGQLRFLLLWIIGHFVLRGELGAHVESSLPPLFSLLRWSFGWWQPHVAGHPAVERTNEQTNKQKKKLWLRLSWNKTSLVIDLEQEVTARDVPPRERKEVHLCRFCVMQNWLHGQLTLKWIFSYFIW